MEYKGSLNIAASDGSVYTTSLSQLTSKSNYTIIYFYPKDCTSGCTIEAAEFSQMVEEFKALGAQVLGVSKDSIASHHEFIAESDLKVDLISDADTSLHQAFGARGEKKMYGRIYLGTIRSTFILDTSGKIITKYTKVTARGHAQLIYDELKSSI